MAKNQKVYPLLSAPQALKTLGLSKRLLIYVEKRFGDQKESLKEWGKIFKKEKIV